MERQETASRDAGSAAEVQRLRDKLAELEKTLKAKDGVIERQRAEITTLRKKNFDLRARALEVEDKYKDQKE